jgi:hypothetical protein
MRTGTHESAAVGVSGGPNSQSAIGRSSSRRPDLIDGQDGVAHDVETIDDPRRFGGDDPKNGVVCLGHVQGAIDEVLLDVVELGSQPPGYTGEVPDREHVDEGEVSHVAHRRRPGLVLERAGSHEELQCRPL